MDPEWRGHDDRPGWVGGGREWHKVPTLNFATQYETREEAESRALVLSAKVPGWFGRLVVREVCRKRGDAGPLRVKQER